MKNKKIKSEQRKAKLSEKEIGIVMLNYKNQQIFMKLNFIRLIQHEIVHILLSELDDDINISYPYILNKNNINILFIESEILAEIELNGGRIDWILSSLPNTLNIEYYVNHDKST